MDEYCKRLKILFGKLALAGWPFTCYLIIVSFLMKFHQERPNPISNQSPKFVGKIKYCLVILIYIRTSILTKRFPLKTKIIIIIIQGLTGDQVLANLMTCSYLENLHVISYENIVVKSSLILWVFTSLSADLSIRNLRQNGFEIKLTRRLSQLNSDTQEINP